MRYYRRVGRRSGVSMGLGTYLVFLIISIAILAAAAQWAIAGISHHRGVVLAIIVCGGIVIVLLHLLVAGQRRRFLAKQAEARATKAAADKASLEENRRRVAATRDDELAQAKRLVDEAMHTGTEERRILLAQARALVTSKGGSTSWDLHPEGELDLARYIDQKRTRS